MYNPIFLAYERQNGEERLLMVSSDEDSVYETLSSKYNLNEEQRDALYEEREVELPDGKVIRYTYEEDGEWLGD